MQLCQSAVGSTTPKPQVVYRVPLAGVAEGWVGNRVGGSLKPTVLPSTAAMHGDGTLQTLRDAFYDAIDDVKEAQ